ncbi:MAG: LppP/LprE family lipoprotein [Microcoleus sp.]|jgi:hypothetical protein
MKASTLFLIGLALAPIAIPTTALSQPDSSWLEKKPLTNWNKPGAAVPKAPENTSSHEIGCQQQIRSASTPEERAVKAAGWTLYSTRGETKSSSGLWLVKGQTGFDGMCRPIGYQEFLFVNGVFAGTTSPISMNARADGSLFQTNIESSSQLTAQFARYATQDALCCPSRTSMVTYRIDFNSNKKPLLVPVDVTTYANHRE